MKRMWRHSKAQTGHGKSEPPVGLDSGPPNDVLTQYGWSSQTAGIMTIPHGFSGARVWQIAHKELLFALKCWPPGHPVYMPLSEIHRLMLMAREAGLKMVPAVMLTIKGQGVVSHRDCLWEATSWQPGTPDANPNDERFRSAIQTLAQLHAVWRTTATGRVGPCPAVQLQTQRLAAWTQDEFELLNRRTGEPILDHAISLFIQHHHTALERLRPWLARQFPLHPCLADVWSDHVLFTSNEVTGMIDFGAMRFDHPAQDLARLIGSYTQGHTERRAWAMASYVPYSDELERLAILLDDTGAVVGLGNWLRWLLIEQRPVDSMKALSRVRWLVDRFSNQTFRA